MHPGLEAVFDFGFSTREAGKSRDQLGTSFRGMSNKGELTFSVGLQEGRRVRGVAPTQRAAPELIGPDLSSIRTLPSFMSLRPKKGRVGSQPL